MFVWFLAYKQVISQTEFYGSFNADPQEEEAQDNDAGSSVITNI